MRRVLWGTAAALAAALALGAAFAWRVWTGLHRPYAGHPEALRRVEVEAGLDAASILARLEEEGVLESARWTRLYVSRYLGDPPLQAGEYEFSAPLSAVAVVDKLVRGEVVTYAVTLIEGLDRFETAHHLAAEGFGDEDVFLRLMADGELVSDLDPSATDLEGYLFPDTYRFARSTSEREIVATLVATFRRRFSDSVAPLLEDDAALPPRDVVILGSIVEKEASVDEERPVVAGVYANRLARGMGLYADPTVIYGLKLQGTWDGNLRRRDLEAETPYNTYRVPGLPPGPICSPGVASLRAAARPAEVPYLYFVSRNDGTHVFARTLAEHNRNVQIWQQRYWRERWAQEGARPPAH
jgi:UPF0755 protein